MAGNAEIKNDIQFKRLKDKLWASLGDEAFNAALERGKLLEVRDVIDELLHQIPGSSR